MRCTIRPHLVRILLIVLLGLGFAPAAAGSDLPSYEPGQIVVKLKSAETDLALLNLLYGTHTLATLLNHPDVVLLAVPMGGDVLQLVQLLGSDPLVEYAEPNYRNEAPDSHTDRTYAWGEDADDLKGQDATKRLHLSQAHTLSQGADTTVAVLDTGLQRDHPAFADGVLLAGYDFVDHDLSPDEVSNGRDDDGDGLIDEALGHGTHVAGIVHLTAPASALLPLRVLDSDGRGHNFRTANAILFAAMQGADTINLSLGTAQPSALIQQVVSEVAQQGVVVVAAAGNRDSTQPQYPAAAQCALAVASVSLSDHKSSFSNYGTWIDIAAPGEEILSAIAPTGYARWSGTSMATPFIAGQVALLRALDADLTLVETGLLIGGTAHSLDSKNADYRGLLGAGRADLLASVQALTSTTWPSGRATLLNDCD